MRRETSLYLDIIRIVAVLLVFIDHGKRAAFTGGFLYRLGVYGQEAVAVFFVLSGLVVSHVTLTREQTFRTYMIARLARLWSVVVPAILLTIVLDSLGWYLAPALYAGEGLRPWPLDAESIWRAICPAVFLNSVGQFHLAVRQVGSNGPFWSLSYEAWYYAAFGAAVFARGWWRILVLAAMIWFVGSDIRWLAPIWLMGVAIRGRLGRGGSSFISWAGWVGSILGLLVLFSIKYKLMGVLEPIIDNMGLPIHADTIVEKYATATLAAFNILCFDRIAGQFRYFSRILDRPVQMIVSHSFSIYLYQAPLLFFFAAMSTRVTARPARILILYCGALGTAFVLAEFTELRKSVLARWLRALLAICERVSTAARALS